MDEAVGGERWIIDGNFLSAGRRALRAGGHDDLPRPAAHNLYRTRAFRRAVRDRGSRRPDLPEGCREGFDWDFLKWIWHFGRDDRPRILETLGRFRGDVVQLRSAAEVQSYLTSVT